MVRRQLAVGRRQQRQKDKKTKRMRGGRRPVVSAEAAGAAPSATEMTRQYSEVRNKVFNGHANVFGDLPKEKR